jgi:hypothetical protein
MRSAYGGVGRTSILVWDPRLLSEAFADEVQSTFYGLVRREVPDKPETAVQGQIILRSENCLSVPKALMGASVLAKSVAYIEWHFLGLSGWVSCPAACSPASPSAVQKHKAEEPA